VAAAAINKKTTTTATVDAIRKDRNADA